jgi:hypothetical protein
MILIEAKENSPYILLEPSEHYMIVKGNSFMTNPSQFYSAINNWISTYTVPTGEQFRIELTMGYYNTTSIQIINLLFKTLHKNNPHKIKLKIFIDKEEEDLIECAGSLTFNTGLVPQIELF